LEATSLKQNTNVTTIGGSGVWSSIQTIVYSPAVYSVLQTAEFGVVNARREKVGPCLSSFAEGSAWQPGRSTGRPI
jgi:hypothetical protein